MMLTGLGVTNQVLAAEEVPPQIIFGAAFSVLILALSGVSWQIARSRAEARRRAAEDRSVAQQGEAARAAEVQAEQAAHQGAIAEAIRREPSLGTSDSPETLAKLAEAAARIREETRAQEARQAVREQEARTADEQAAAERRRAAAEAAAARVQKAEEARRIEQAKAAEARAEWLDTLPGWRRWVATHRGIVATVAAVLVVAIASGGIVLQMAAREEQARLAQEAEAAEAAAAAEQARQVKADRAAAKEAEAEARRAERDFERQAENECRELTRQRMLAASCSITGVDFRGVDLHGLDLSYVQVRDSDLSGTDFTGANLVGAEFNDTDLTGADFTGADLAGATLSANLTEADFADALLIDATIVMEENRGAAFVGADLSGATFVDSANAQDRKSKWKVDLSNADLTGAKVSTSTQTDRLIFIDGDLREDPGLKMAPYMYAVWSNTTCPDGTVVDDPGDCPIDPRGVLQN